jgi:hypothetical protein
VRRYEPRPKRTVTHWGSNPERLVPVRDAEGRSWRSVQWTKGGIRYALGYEPHPTLFGTRLRHIRHMTLLSARMTLESVAR